MIYMKELNQKDISILRKLAPCSDSETAGGILTTLSRYCIIDKDDFLSRLKKLSDEELKYLAERAMDGSECLLCIAPQCAETFLDAIEKRLSPRTAGRLREIFESTTGHEK
ncbi:MAG: hypothetical protein A4E49_00740 [Methanosaeta sp. PtaU1.Bin112]|nr:MAG: hypothetical protein A4E49_00740 [Methanosaeta sp. PtaU1.Bin112]